MPTNVPPQYRALEEQYRQATSTEEKIALLEEMLRTIPKHKATDRMQGELKAKLSKLRAEPKSKTGTSQQVHVIAREGAGQIALAGLPNTGKSSLLAALTNAEPKIGDYPFTTREPQPGMARFEDVPLQLLDLPPLSEEHVEPWVYDNLRRADLIWLVVDSAGAMDGVERVTALCEPKHLGLVPEGQEPDAAGKPPGWMPKPTLLVVTGSDTPEHAENMEILRELMDVSFPVFEVSTVTRQGLEALLRRTFEALGLIRIYTKQPGKDPDTEAPFTLPHGATVEDLAATIHRDLPEKLKFARVWGEGVFEGQQVTKDHVLHEGNVVELHLT